MTTTTSTGISGATVAHVTGKMLEYAQPVMVLRKSAKMITMPKNKSTTIKWSRANQFTAAVTPLTEGVTPSASTFTQDTVTATLNQYGDFSTITDVIEDTITDPILESMSEQHGENIGRTNEALDFAVFKAGTNVTYNNGTARNEVNTAITLNKVRACVRALQEQKAKRITKVLNGSVNVGTKPIEASWVAYGHTDLEADIRNLAGFTPVSEYGNRKIMCDEELGSVENVRFVLSPDLTPFADAGGAAGSMKSTTGTSADIYPLLIHGRDAWGCVGLGGYGSVEPKIKPIGSAGSADPLDQQGSVGWKSWHAAVILNEAWAMRLEVGATEL